MSTIWKTEQEKDREKEKVGGRPAKIKNKGDIFLLEEQHENFAAAVRKQEMLEATQCTG